MGPTSLNLIDLLRREDGDSGFQKRSNEANGVHGRQGHGELLHGSPLEPGLRPGWRVGLRSQETQAGLPVGPLAFPGISTPPRARSARPAANRTAAKKMVRLRYLRSE